MQKNLRPFEVGRWSGFFSKYRYSTSTFWAASSSVISPLERPARITLTYECSSDQFWSASKQSLAMRVNWSVMKVTTGDSDWLAPSSISIQRREKNLLLLVAAPVLPLPVATLRASMLAVSAPAPF